MFIAVPKLIQNQVTDVSPGFWRIQAVTINTSSSTNLLINSYFPQDPKTLQFDDNELKITMQFINEVIDANNFQSLLWS